jgi:hypothetical protein
VKIGLREYAGQVPEIQALNALAHFGTRVVAVIYTGGTVAHLIRLIFQYTGDIPFFIDWLLVLLGPIGVVGLTLGADRVDYRGRWERVVHWLIVVHLGSSILVHIWILAVNSHRVLAVFSLGYSYFAAIYFAFFAWRSWTIRLRAPGSAA